MPASKQCRVSRSEVWVDTPYKGVRFCSGSAQALEWRIDWLRVVDDEKAGAHYAQVQALGMLEPLHRQTCPHAVAHGSSAFAATEDYQMPVPLTCG